MRSISERLCDGILELLEGLCLAIHASICYVCLDWSKLCFRVAVSAELRWQRAEKGRSMRHCEAIGIDRKWSLRRIDGYTARISYGGSFGQGRKVVGGDGDGDRAGSSRAGVDGQQGAMATGK